MLKHSEMKQKFLNSMFFVLAYFALGFVIISSTYQDKLMQIINSFHAWQFYIPHEKLYIHTDKDYYTIGENIWFKGYLVNGQNQTDTLSRIVYAELINEDLEIVGERMLKVEKFTCNGDFVIPDTLAPGTYQLRAYTNYMRNFDDDFFFKKNIPVFSAGHKKYSWQITSAHSDTISVNSFMYKVELRDRNNDPVPNTSVEYKIKAKRLKTARGELKTENDGTFYIVVDNPIKKQVEGCTLELSFPKQKEKWAYNLALQREQPLVRFFPEGGNLVRNIQNQIAIKTTNTKGLGIKGVVKIFNQDSTLISVVNCNHLGFGSFSFTPTSHEEYFAYLKVNGTEYGRFALPKTEEHGYILQVNNFTKDKVYIKAARNFDADLQESWTILCQTKGEVIYKLTGICNNGELMAGFPKDNLATGVYQLTLFDENYIPQCERLIFIKSEKDDEPDFELELYQEQNGTYSFEGIVYDENIKWSNFSVSVLNTNIVDDLLPYNDNIVSYMHLSSELKGKIESPGYYFKDNSLQRRTDLDYLLMTQGWRKFVWKEMLDGDAPDLNYTIEKAIKISGKISNYSKKGKIGDEVTLMLIDSTNTQAYVNFSDDEGRFNFYAHLNNTIQGLIQTKRKKSNVDRRLTLNKKTPPLASNFNSYAADIKTYESIEKVKKSGQVRELVEELFEFKTDRTIDEVKVTAKSLDREMILPPYPQKVLMVEELEDEIENRRSYEYQSIFHFIADNYIGTTTRKSHFVRGYGLTGKPISANLVAPGGSVFLYVKNKLALAVLDDRPIRSYQLYMEYLQSIDWRSIEKVIVYDRGACNFDPTQPCEMPVVLIYRNPDGVTRVRHRGIRNFKIKGYNVAREFYHPVISEDVKANIPEYRSTVYWNPEVVADESGLFTFQLNRKDIPEKIKVIIEGMADNGLPLHQEFEFFAN